MLQWSYKPAPKFQTLQTTYIRSVHRCIEDGSGGGGWVGGSEGLARVRAACQMEKKVFFALIFGVFIFFVLFFSLFFCFVYSAALLTLPCFSRGDLCWVARREGRLWRGCLFAGSSAVSNIFAA